MEPESDAALLLDMLNTEPVVGDLPVDRWSDAAELHRWLEERSLPRGAATLASARAVREDLRQVVWGERSAQTLATWLEGARHVPLIGEEGALVWRTKCPESAVLAVRTVLAYFDIAERRPGRLRPCGNPECRLFLLDTSRSNTARWCSMATCGNRLKARRHHARSRSTPEASEER